MVSKVLKQHSLVLTVVLALTSLSCTTTDTDQSLADPDQFLASLDNDISNVNDGTVEDFAIEKSYEAFDPSGIAIKFDFDSDSFTAQTLAALDKIVAGMKKDALARIYVRGHADKQGPEVYNDDLSRRRAAKIEAYLVNNGIDRDRLITVHLGEREPLVNANTVSAYKQNRRGDFMLDYGDTAFTQN